MDIGKNIKKYRNAKNLSQHDLSRMIGKSERMVQLYERGNTAPTLENLKSLSNILGVSLITLMTGEDDYGSLNGAIENIEKAIKIREQGFMELAKQPENISYDKGVLDGLKIALIVINQLREEI